MTSSLLRIAVVQFAPKIGEVSANIAKARALCLALPPRSVDLVCLPEMIFTGYMFPDAPSIAPFLEDARTGPTAAFCEELARRVGCLVVAGVAARAPAPVEAAPPAIGTNAALLYAPSGLRHVFRKHHLFETDLPWARAGPGFEWHDAPGMGRVGVAICNDLNPRAGAWRSVEDGPYELAGWCVREGVRVLVLVNAWLKHGREGGEGSDGSASGEDGDGDGTEPNWEVLRYWATRLRPLWAAAEAKTGATGTWGARSVESADVLAEEQRDVIVVCCNRCGRERGRTFAGSSAMFAMRPGSGRPKLLHFMGEREEGVRVWTAKVGSETLQE